MDSWRVGMLAHSRLQSHRRLIDRTRGEIETALEVSGRWYLSFSGGKDSAALLHLVLSVAGSIDAMHDEDELTAPGTAEYVESLRRWPGVTLTRLAHPIRHGEHCTSWGEPPFVRPLPAEVLWFDDEQAWLRHIARWWVGGFVGTRIEENRRRAVSYNVRGSLYQNAHRDVWVSTPLHHWTVQDVWAYLVSREVPYHPGYDIMRACGIAPANQRIGPVGNDHALVGGSMAWYRMCWPAEFLRVAQRYPWIAEYA
jgi:3'-phosphoadenosine 5'-phosphosulfate sulfotransferase (PAPS reductase)/FAD synthetase